MIQLQFHFLSCRMMPRLALGGLFISPVAFAGLGLGHPGSSSRFSVLTDMFQVPSSKFHVSAWLLCHVGISFEQHSSLGTMQLGSAEPNHISFRDSCTQSRCSCSEVCRRWATASSHKLAPWDWALDCHVDTSAQ